MKKLVELMMAPDSLEDIRAEYDSAENTRESEEETAWAAGGATSRDLSGTAECKRGQNLPDKLPGELGGLPRSQVRRLEPLVAHFHANLNHASSRTMVKMLKRAKAHRHIIAMAKVYRCEACDALEPAVVARAWLT